MAWTLKWQAKAEEWQGKAEEFKVGWDAFWEAQKFENWAPRSSRAWRLREFSSETDAQYREASARPRQEAEAAAPGGEDEDVCDDLWSPAEFAKVRDGGLALGEGGEPAIPTAFGECLEASEGRARAGGGQLTGAELAELCLAKYGKRHDMAIKHVQINKKHMRRWVALNVYVGCLEQRSFPYSEEEYLEKLDCVAALLSAWKQEEYTRDFFREPPIPRRGLPAYPRVDTAVSLRLNKSPTWDDALAEDYFSY